MWMYTSHPFLPSCSMDVYVCVCMHIMVWICGPRTVPLTTSSLHRVYYSFSFISRLRKWQLSVTANGYIIIIKSLRFNILQLLNLTSRETSYQLSYTRYRTPLKTIDAPRSLLFITILYRYVRECVFWQHHPRMPHDARVYWNALNVHKVLDEKRRKRLSSKKREWKVRTASSKSSPSLSPSFFYYRRLISRVIIAISPARVSC